MRYAPTPSVDTLYLTPVSLFVATTCDFGTAAPLESVTVPTRLLSMVWAHIRIALKTAPPRIRPALGTTNPLCIRCFLILRKEARQTVVQIAESAIRLYRRHGYPQEAEIPRYLKDIGPT